MNKVELLAPAGDLEKLKIAVEYGADAVYFGGEAFSLRTGAGNLTFDEMKEGIKYAHDRGVRCHLAINIYAHNEDIAELPAYLEAIKDFGIDAFIVSDPGIIEMIKEIIPGASLHLSTQSNTTNYASARFWHKQGIERLVLARELSLEEIKTLKANSPEDLEIEAFIHGAMCISYSGRCLLSNFMTGRDANRGACAHPCRYKYRLEEEKRPGEYWPVEEDGRGTYIFNSKDLCMIEHIPELIEAGINSFKIEGRIKSVFYVASVISAYRKAIDAYYADPEGYKFNPDWMTDMTKASHREYTTGFYFGKSTSETQNYETSQYIRDYSFVGIVLDYDEETGMAYVEQRNKMSVGEEVEFFGPKENFKQKLEVMLNEDKEPIESAPHPQQKLYIKTDKPVAVNFMIRKEK